MKKDSHTKIVMSLTDLLVERFRLILILRALCTTYYTDKYVRLWQSVAPLHSYPFVSRPYPYGQAQE